MNEIADKTEGKIVKLVRHRGFGFIDAEGESEDVFFHHSNVENSYFEDLAVGDELKFEINTSDRGPEATNIEKLNIAEGPLIDEPSSEEGIENHLGW